MILFILGGYMDYKEEMFKEYEDIVDPKQLKKMLGNKIGTNKVYDLLRKKEIYSKRIGNNYLIPKVSVIEYIMKK